MSRQSNPGRPNAGGRIPFRAALVPVALWLFFLPGFPGGGKLQAESVNYAADEILARTHVDISSLRGRPVTLEELFALTETQTRFRFVYVANRIPVDGQLAFESGGVMTLARLFSNISSLANVVFQRRNQKIIVRGPLPDPGPAGHQPPQAVQVSGTP
ncbi:hypothetical protein OpiT1DRAFT_03456 [Opitutaceae bacterium TAV1]|nr:hypothetical protein OpiT1DRAFT_03456 [Opitutaceae bacterium TAV1]